jgi:ribosome-associated protein
MIEITPSVKINEDEIEYAYMRSPGPGGQNVNKVSSAVQLRFNIREASSIPDEVKQRLTRLAGKRMASGGVLIIEARQYRSQERNRQAALQRLVQLVQRASTPAKTRHKTKPTPASVERRLEDKHKRSEIKRQRHESDTEG